MNKKCTLLLLLVAANIHLKAQTTYFSQSFDGTSPDFTTFVNASPNQNANLFDYSFVNGTSSISTTSNVLNLTRINGATGAASMTKLSAGLPTTGSVLQLSFKYEGKAVSGATGSSMGGFFILGAPSSTDGGTGSILQNDNATLKLRFETNNTNNQFRLVNFINASSIVASSWFPFGDAIQVDVIFNTTNKTATYTSPASTPGVTLEAGKVDIYINNILQRTITGKSLINPNIIPVGFKINLQSVAQSIELDDIVIKDASNVVLSVK